MIKGFLFEVKYYDELLGKFEILLFGEYNVLNSMVVIVVFYFEKVNLDEIWWEFFDFSGVK